MEGARGVIINVTGGPDLTLAEVSEASEIVYNAAHEDANIIFGAVVDPKMEGQVKITVIATGFDKPSAAIAPAAQERVQTPVDMSAYVQRPMPEDRPAAVAGKSVVVVTPSGAGHAHGQAGAGERHDWIGGARRRDRGRVAP